MKIYVIDKIITYIKLLENYNPKPNKPAKALLFPRNQVICLKN